MGRLYNRTFSKAQWDVHKIEYVHPLWVLNLRNLDGEAKTYRVGTGLSADGPFMDPAPVVLTGTLTLTKDSANVVGVGTAFTTELTAGSVICLADGKVLAQVKSITNDTNLVLEEPWAGATAAGATAYNGTLQTRTLAAGKDVTARHDLPKDTAGTPIATHKFIYVESVSGPLAYDLDAGPTQITLARDSLTEQLL